MHWLPAILVLPYFLILLLIYRSLLKIKANSLNSEPVTFVSIVIACRNEQKNLQNLLNCLNTQDYPEDLFEIIIVDDNSTDKTYQIASASDGYGKRIVLHSEGYGKKMAIRTGISAASGILIITTDADCRMGKNWIRSIAAFYEKNRPDMIICPVQIKESPGFFGKFQELEFLGLQGITAGTALAGESTMCNGANLSFTRVAYMDNAGNLHDEIASGDDIFLLHSLKKKSHSKILWLESSDAIVTAAASPGLISYLNQRKRWISKGKSYSDKFTILLGNVTFVTILIHLVLLVATFLNQVFLQVLLAVFLLKSVPDFLILYNTAVRYRKPKLMYWFIPAQIVYPFYVLAVAFYSLMSPEREEN